MSDTKGNATATEESEDVDHGDDNEIEEESGNVEGESDDVEQQSACDEEGDGDDNGDGEDASGGGSGSTTNVVGRKPLSGQSCSLRTLVVDHILDPGDGVLIFDMNGTNFVGDLLPNGNIRWQETKQIFPSPSSWVNQIKKIMNCENKSGSAWSTIRYKGKRLDSYKLRWYRRQKKMVTTTSGKLTGGESALDSHALQLMAKMAENRLPLESFSLSDLQKKGNIDKNLSLIREKHNFDHDNHRPNETKGKSANKHKNSGKDRCYTWEESRHVYSKSCPGVRDMNVMVRCVPFSSMDRIQPFTVTVSTNALLLIDFHCHLTNGEVCGYLAGTWDIASHNVAILQAFPCRSRLADRTNAALVEEEVKQALERRHLHLVGWYHSHPNTMAQPTIKDIESQMEYQIAMKGESDSSYTPCVGLICSPFDENNEEMSATYQLYWVMPPPEYKPNEYGKPMHMIYSVARDSFLTQDLLLEMRLLAHFYAGSPDSILFSQEFKSSGYSYWQRLQLSLKPKLPRDLQVFENQTEAQAQVQQQALSHFWAFIKGLIMP